MSEHIAIPIPGTDEAVVIKVERSGSDDPMPGHERHLLSLQGGYRNGTVQECIAAIEALKDAP